MNHPLMPFRFEPLELYRADRVTAWANASSYDGHAFLELTFLDNTGQEVSTTLHFDKDANRYVRDLAEAINRTANNHGRLTTFEQGDLIGVTDEEDA